MGYILNNTTLMNFVEAQQAMLSDRSETLAYNHSASGSSEHEESAQRTATLHLILPWVKESLVLSPGMALRYRLSKVSWKSKWLLSRKRLRSRCRGPCRWLVSLSLVGEFLAKSKISGIPAVQKGAMSIMANVAEWSPYGKRRTKINLNYFRYQIIGTDLITDT